MRTSRRMGVAALTMIAACATPGGAEAVRQAQAQEIAADADRAWVMLVSYDGIPVWVAKEDIERATATDARHPEATVISVLLKDKDGSGQEGWAIARERYDCSNGQVRTLWSETTRKDGMPPEPPSYEEDFENYHPIIPHTPPVVISAALCDGEGAPPAATEVTGTAADLWAHQAKLRRDALGY